MEWKNIQQARDSGCFWDVEEGLWLQLQYLIFCNRRKCDICYFWMVECDVIFFELFHNLKLSQNKLTFKNKRKQKNRRKEKRQSNWELRRKARTWSTSLGLTTGPVVLWSLIQTSNNYENSYACFIVSYRLKSRAVVCMCVYGGYVSDGEECFLKGLGHIHTQHY